MLNKTILVAGTMLCTVIVTGCENTWHGMGRDMQRNGQEMQHQYR